MFSVSAGCRHLGVTYTAGDIFPMGDDCNTCKCLRTGKVQCSEKKCHPGNYECSRLYSFESTCVAYCFNSKSNCIYYLNTPKQIVLTAPHLKINLNISKQLIISSSWAVWLIKKMTSVVLSLFLNSAKCLFTCTYLKWFQHVHGFTISRLYQATF